MAELSGVDEAGHCLEVNIWGACRLAWTSCQ